MRNFNIFVLTEVRRRNFWTSLLSKHHWMLIVINIHADAHVSREPALMLCFSSNAQFQFRGFCLFHLYYHLLPVHSDLSLDNVWWDTMTVCLSSVVCEVGVSCLMALSGYCPASRAWVIIHTAALFIWRVWWEKRQVNTKELSNPLHIARLLRGDLPVLWCWITT